MLPQKIRPFLWFDQAAEPAAEFYCSLFPNSKIQSVSRFPEGSMAPAGSVMTVSFLLAGVEYVALNGGPMYQFTPAVSLAVDCDDQPEVDFLWERLLEGGGKSLRCGWIQDRWGLTWQIVPRALPKLLASQQPGVAQRVTAAMLQMIKLDVAALERAAAAP